MVEFFVRKRAAVFTFALLVVIMGTLAYITLPREFTPEIKQPYIFVTTLYPGVGAKDMENLVTRVIEEEVDGVDGLDELTSSTRQSVSFILAQFTSDVDAETALRRVRDAVDNAQSQLPDDVEDPVVEALSSSTWPILTAVLSHPDGVLAINDYADKVQERLERVSGVNEVDVAGKREMHLLIELDPDKLERYGYSMNDVISAVQGENRSIPGGTLKSDARNYSLSVTGEIKQAGRFGDVMVSAQGVKTRLAELGKTAFTWKEPESYSRLDGNPSISFYVKKQPGANIVEVAEEARQAVEKMQAELPRGTIVSFPNDQSISIRNLLSDLENNIITAFILVMGVTLFFLGFRNALFVALAVPFSMLMSFYVLQLLGITLNMVVLFSLVLALGMLVDNGIVIVENIFRHAGMGKPRRQAAVEGAQEVSLPIFASTLTTCLGFFPVIFMPDVMGDFMSYLPKTIIVVLASSLVVALTINPVFCASFLRITEQSRKRMTEGSGLFMRFAALYERMLRAATAHSTPVIGVVLVTVVLGFVFFYFAGKEPIFFPHMDPETGVVELTLPQGTPLDKTNAYVREAEAFIDSVPASLKAYVAAAGRGGGGSRFGGQEDYKGSIRLEFAEFRKRNVPATVTLDSLRRAVGAIPGPEFKVMEQEMGPPTGSPISYQIVGEEYAVLGAFADTIMSYLQPIEELKVVETDFADARPEISVNIDRRKAKLYGLSTSQISSTIRNAVHGATIGKFRPGGTSSDEYDVVVRFPRKHSNSLQRLAALQIVNRDGARIPLASVARLSRQSSVGVIRRRDLRRSVEVSADFKEGVENKSEIKAHVDSLVKRMRFPEGYRVGEGSGLRMRAEAQEFLGKAFLIAIFLILIVLIAQFNSIVQPFIIIFSVMLAIGGVMWGYAISGMQFVIITTGIGCIALAGVVVNNCIVLIDYTNLLIKDGMFWREAVVEAGKTRLRPVLLTAITTILGLLPMAFGVSFDFRQLGLQFGSEAGAMWVSFAWTVIFGLSFATIMTLVVVPCLLTVSFRFFENAEVHRNRRRQRKAAREG